MSSEHFGQLAWQFKRMSGSSGLKVLDHLDPAAFDLVQARAQDFEPAALEEQVSAPLHNPRAGQVRKLFLKASSQLGIDWFCAEVGDVLHAGASLALALRIPAACW